MSDHKPTFTSVADLAARVINVVRNGHRLLELSGAFRERLMLAVTGVNDCRYCRFLHTRVASVSGVSSAEQEAILEGDFSRSPEPERAALVWARTWAEQGGQADGEQLDRLAEIYGEKRAKAVAAAVEAIAIGNYTGNGLDRILKRF